jgi:hypothetical protein
LTMSATLIGQARREGREHPHGSSLRIRSTSARRTASSAIPIVR